MRSRTRPITRPVTRPIDHGLGALGSGGGASGPTAPVLVWTSDTSDLTPEGTATFDVTIGAGDKFFSEIKMSSQAWSDIVATEHPIDIPEDVADAINLVLSALAPGSYDWRVRLQRASDSLYSAYSNIESKTLVSSNNRTSATGDRRISATGVVRVYA